MDRNAARTGRRSARALTAAVVLLGSGLAGCGFTPLYATPGVSPALESVQVEVPQTRVGFLLKQQLNDQLARDTDLPARYHLKMDLQEYRYPRGTIVNNVASLYELGVTANYTLSDTVTGRVLLQGKAPVEVSYDSSTPPYSGTAANQEGQQRLAEQAAVNVRLALSRYFEAQANPSAKPAAVVTPDSSNQIGLPSLRKHKKGDTSPSSVFPQQ